MKTKIKLFGIKTSIFSSVETTTTTIYGQAAYYPGEPVPEETLTHPPS